MTSVLDRDPLQERPSLFTTLQRKYCCEYAEHWIDGRGAPAITIALDQLQMGQIAVEPIQAEFSYVIPKRVQPTAESLDMRFELPNPSEPDILAVVRSRDGAFLRAQLQDIAREILNSEIWSKQTAAQIATLHRDGQRFYGADTSEARVKEFSALLEAVRTLTEPSTYVRYQSILNSHFEQLLLGSNGVSH